MAAGSVLAAVGDTEIVSISSNGGPANGSAISPNLSSDGRYVVFQGDQLVPGDTNGKDDVFVRDRLSGTTERVSVSSGGDEGNNHSQYPDISGDGRYVVFESQATTLVSADANGVNSDIFLHDRSTGTTEIVSLNSSGDQGNSSSNYPSISQNGRYVVFTSSASNLVANDTNNTHDIFVRDLLSGTTERVSVDSSGNQADQFSFSAFISNDGRYVLFQSPASNLVSGDTNSKQDVFLHDRLTGTTERVSVDSSGNQADDESFIGSISDDGRYVAFTSTASNLVAGDTNGKNDVFLRDRVTGTTERISVDEDGNEVSERSYGGSISSDGRYIAFSSEAENLVPGDSNGYDDVFIYDRISQSLSLVSVSSEGVQSDYYSYDPHLSPNGDYVVFFSYSNILVANDQNVNGDIFIRQLLGDETGSTSGGGPASKEISGSGTTVFQSGRIIVSVPSNAIPDGESNCKVSITKKGDSRDYGFSLDDTVWDVKIVCDSGTVSILYAPVSVCIRPVDGVTSDKQVFHKHSAAFGALASTGERSGYACGQTQTLSLFTLGSVAVPNTGFAPGVVTVLPEQPASAAYAASDLTLSIPELGLDMDIVGVPQGPNGWDVSWLGNDAGYLYGTAFPTMAGNTVLTAHVWNADNTPGPFAHLDELQYGDRFSITAWGSTYTYEVRSTSLYSPNSLRPLRHEETDWVTLLTCAEFNETSGQYAYRRAVRAVLVSID